MNLSHKTITLASSLTCISLQFGGWCLVSSPQRVWWKMVYSSQLKELVFCNKMGANLYFFFFLFFFYPVETKMHSSGRPCRRIQATHPGIFGNLFIARFGIMPFQFACSPRARRVVVLIVSEIHRSLCMEKKERNVLTGVNHYVWR